MFLAAQAWLGIIKVVVQPLFVRMDKSFSKIVFIVFFLAVATGLYFLFDYWSGAKKFGPGANSISTSFVRDFDVGVPVRLQIPKINVDAVIKEIGLTETGNVQAPEGAEDVGWFNLGPRPGELGSSVITGHFGGWKNGGGSVFDNLKKLEKGDKIYIKDAKDNNYTFLVKEIKTYNSDEIVPDVFKGGGIYLNLITCEGEWIKSQKTYTKRLVVYTQAI